MEIIFMDFALVKAFLRFVFADRLQNYLGIDSACTLDR